MLPPPDFDKSFLMYTINTEMLPTYYNGTRKDGGNVTISVKDIDQIHIRVAAVCCRPGYMDSEVVVRNFLKGVEKKDEKEFMVRPADQVIVE